LAENLTIDSLIEELESKFTLNLGHFGTLKMSDKGVVTLEIPCSIVQNKSLSETEIFTTIQKYIAYKLNPPKFSGKGKKKPATLDGLKKLVK
jgi:hypothetical protein